MMVFINFTGNNAKSTSQRRKALGFFGNLQEIKPLLQKFSNEEFRRSVMFPYLRLRKQNRRWTLMIAIGEEFYYYPYPFFFPASFLHCKNKYDLEMKIQLIESFSTVDLEKRFLLESFLNQFSVPNKERKKIKKQLIDLFSELRDFGFIEKEIRLTSTKCSNMKIDDHYFKK